MAIPPLVHKINKHAPGSEVPVFEEEHRIGEDIANFVFLNGAPLNLAGAFFITGTPAGGGSFSSTTGTPAAGEYKLTFAGRAGGQVEFHEDDAGIVVKFTYLSRGDVLWARDINRLILWMQYFHPEAFTNPDGSGGGGGGTAGEPGSEFNYEQVYLNFDEILTAEFPATNETVVSRGGANETYEAKRDGAGTGSLTGAHQSEVGLYRDSSGSLYVQHRRDIIVFDTTGMTTPETARVVLHVVSKERQDFDPQYLYLLPADPADPNTILGSDYEEVSHTDPPDAVAYADEIALTDMVPGQPIQFNLNATGLAALDAAITGAVPFVVGTRVYGGTTRWPNGSPGYKSRVYTASKFNPDATIRPKIILGF